MLRRNPPLLAFYIAVALLFVAALSRQRTLITVALVLGGSLIATGGLAVFTNRNGAGDAMAAYARRISQLWIFPSAKVPRWFVTAWGAAAFLVGLGWLIGGLARVLSLGGGSTFRRECLVATERCRPQLLDP